LRFTKEKKVEEVKGVLSLALRSMHQDMSRLDRVAMNLANALTPGYKREVVVAQPFGQVVNELVSASSSGNTTTAKMQVHTDFRPGSLKSTGQSLDFAIAGEGYFEVLTDNGPAYTRQGNFRVDAQGRLTTTQGHPVMGQGGEIYLNNATPTVDASGRVQDGLRQGPVTAALSTASAASQLKVVKFDQPQSLQRLGDGLLVGGGSVAVMSDAEVQIRQGFLENSNVSSMQEMVQMTQTMRHFESMHKVAMGYDEMMGVAIRKLGELS
jgi:flagellar basal-body rod protein FlgF